MRDNELDETVSRRTSRMSAVRPSTRAGWAGLALLLMSSAAIAAPPAFAPYVAMPANWAEALAITDLDGDGRNDVVMTDPDLLLYYQSPDGSLAAPMKLAGGNGRSVTAGDFNGDGRVDIATTSNTGGILWYAGAGNRSFTPAPTLGFHAYQMLEAADVDVDGRTDLVAMQWSANELHVFYQLPSGEFSAAVPVSAPVGGWNDMKIVDVTADGRKDIVFSSLQNPGNNRVGIAVQRADGAFEPPLYPADPFGTTIGGPWAIAAMDVNADGSIDLVAGAGALVVLFNHGGTFDKSIQVPGGGLTEAIRIGDVNMDGYDDAVVVHGGSLSAGVLTRAPSGGLNGELLFPLPYASHYSPQGLGIGDLNGDGRPDLAIADYNHGLVVLHNLTGACVPFGDIESANPFCANVEWLRNRAITLGCTASSLYCPDAAVTRLAMAAFQNRLGSALTPEVRGAQQSLTMVFPGSGVALCQTPPFSASGFPRAAEIDVVVFATSGADVDLAISPVFSMNGWTWQPAGSAPLRTTVAANRWASVRLLGHRDVAVGETILFAAQVALAAPGSANLSSAGCNVRARFTSRNGSASPF
jgi:FG-GAP-like repeat